METADELQRDDADVRSDQGARMQAGVYLLELSPDWIVARASENVGQLLGHSVQTIIDEPLANFVDAQALHDLRNLFARLSGTLGIARAYGVRLTERNAPADIAFQQVNGRVLLEAVPSSGNFGECFGTVAGLIDGLSDARGQALLDGAARRMRALTGYDRVILDCAGAVAESSRRVFTATVPTSDNLPPIVSDTTSEAVPIYPARANDSGVAKALFRSADDMLLYQLRTAGIGAILRIPFLADGISAEFRCDSRSPRPPNLELHAAAELFAQLVSLRLQLDRLKG